MKTMNSMIWLKCSTVTAFVSRKSYIKKFHNDAHANAYMIREWLIKPSIVVTLHNITHNIALKPNTTYGVFW